MAKNPHKMRPFGYFSTACGIKITTHFNGILFSDPEEDSWQLA
jgi:hypothetical protein